MGLEMAARALPDVTKTRDARPVIVHWPGIELCAEPFYEAIRRSYIQRATGTNTTRAHSK